MINTKVKELIMAPLDFTILTRGMAGSYSQEYVETWRMAKYQHDAEDWFSLQINTSDIESSLYGLIGLKLINSHLFIESANELGKAEAGVNKLNIANAIKYIESTVFSNPLNK